jgi:hypothetical protein
MKTGPGRYSESFFSLLILESDPLNKCQLLRLTVSEAPSLTVDEQLESRVITCVTLSSSPMKDLAQSRYPVKVKDNSN